MSKIAYNNNIWKYDISGNERPLEEQLLRRQGDLLIIEEKIAHYRKSPLYTNPLKRNIASRDWQKHYTKVFRDIQKIEAKIEKINTK